MMRSAIIGAVVATAAGSTYMTCPSTAAWGPAAGMEITTIAPTECAYVKSEILGRIDGQSTGVWIDPHNNGTYTLLKSSIDGQGNTVLATERLTGDGKYTDKQIFTLSEYHPWDKGSNFVCKIEACSRSQVLSIYDMGTNYCDLKMLYCGTSDGCKPVGEDFPVGKETTAKFSMASVDLTKCLKTPPVTMTCPSTNAQGGYAFGMRITTVATASCDKVEAEMKARVNGQSTKAWRDPHKGKYALQAYGGTLSTSHDEYSDGHGHTERQIFTLTPDGDNCKIDACSRSDLGPDSATSDMGTNYCDLKMLFCGKADGCKPVDNDFTVGSETNVKFIDGSSVDLKKCFVNAEATVVV